jgi:hypothetical protein
MNYKFLLFSLYRFDGLRAFVISADCITAYMISTRIGCKVQPSANEYLGQFE